MVAGENQVCKKAATPKASFGSNYSPLPSTAQLQACGYSFISNGYKRKSLVTIFLKMSMTSNFLILLTKFNRELRSEL